MSTTRPSPAAMLSTKNGQRVPFGAPGVFEVEKSVRVRPCASSERTSSRWPASTHTARWSSSTGPAISWSPGSVCACTTGPATSARDEPGELEAATLAHPPTAHAAATSPSPGKRRTRRAARNGRDRLARGARIGR